jgi:release factor glutamine methyltransferase
VSDPQFPSDPPTTISTALAEARQRLSAVSETPGLEARLLLGKTLGQDTSWLLAHPEDTLSDNDYEQFNHEVELLLGGTPLPYLLGEWEFYGLTFQVTPDVLIPRPETELLVETALEWLQGHPQPTQAAEVGTGSGCVAVSLTANAPRLNITATDISPAALEIAGANASRHGVSERIKFKHNNLLSGIPGPFDLIVANLPYIPSNTLRGLENLQNEPALALDGGPDGLDLIRRLLEQAAGLLSKPGLALLEIEFRQGEQAKRLAEENFPGCTVHVKPDLAGKPRLLVIEK